MIVVATLGDSITAGTPGWDPDSEVREAKGARDERSQYQYWAAAASPDLTFVNHGVNGERTDQIALRLEHAARGADAIVVQGAINDIVQGRPVQDAAADLLAIAGRARRLGLPVAIADVLPWNNGWPDNAESIDELNRLVAEAAGEQSIPILPFHDTLASAEQPGCMPQEWTSDGSHPSVEGYRRLGEFAFSRWW
ncbi:MAG: SGNH/GDSL hydrolase family protein [Solirubrobacteraceae bacterium]